MNSLFGDGLFDNTDDIFGISELSSDEVSGFVLLDESVIQKKNDNELNATIEVQTSDARYPNTPYIKISKGNNWRETNPKNRTRISLEFIYYIEHDGKHGDPGTWKLKPGEKEKLMDALRSPYGDKEGHTLWDEILDRAVKENQGMDPVIKNTPLLDYNKLSDKTEERDYLIAYDDPDEEKKREKAESKGELYAPGLKQTRIDRIKRDKGYK